MPGPVAGLTGQVTFFTVELSWSPPQVPNGVIISYDVMFKVNDSTPIRTTNVAATSGPPSHTISDLTPQTTISDITVTARTRIGPGQSTAFSNIFTSFSKPCECI